MFIALSIFLRLVNINCFGFSQKLSVKYALNCISSLGITAVYHPFSLAKNALSQDYM